MENIEVLKKAIALLGRMSRGDDPFGVSGLSRELAMPKTTVHRILSTLCSVNVVIRTESGLYKIGPTVLLWSGGYKFSTGLIEIARPYLEKLREESQEAISLTAPSFRFTGEDAAKFGAKLAAVAAEISARIS